jgi:hypothetical protein
MKHITPLLIAATISSAFAQVPSTSEMQQQLDAAPLESFRFIGNTIVCKSAKAENFACMNIGPIQIGAPTAGISQFVGSRYKRLIRGNGVLSEVYVIRAENGEQAYWVIDSYKEVIKAIQLTGNFNVPNLNFSGIYIGDHKEKVRAILGDRFVELPVAEIKGTAWDYKPFEFTFEFKDDKVYSIRIYGNP